jgi:hypothetical protein
MALGFMSSFFKLSRFGWLRNLRFRTLALRIGRKCKPIDLNFHGSKKHKIRSWTLQRFWIAHETFRLYLAMRLSVSLGKQ